MFKWSLGSPVFMGLPLSEVSLGLIKADKANPG